MIKAIIFDFDGVLVESVDVKTKAFARLFEAYGHQVVQQVVDYHLANGGVTRREKFKYYYREILHEPLSETKLDELCQQFSDFVVEQIIIAPFVIGAADFLDRNHAKYDLFVVSATPQDEMRDIISRRGMSRYFKSIYGAPREKALLIKDILNSGNYKSVQTLYIGDALNDYEEARKVGCHFVGRVPPGSKNPFRPGTIVTPDLSSLAGIITHLDNEKAE